MNEERVWRLLTTAEDITPEIEADVIDCVSWFSDSPTMGTQEFIDQLCKTYGGNGWGDDSWDFDSYDNAAARKVMRIARAARKEENA